jgi:hypothetical protein
MIWVRRVFTIPFILVFFLLFAALLLVTQVNCGLGSATFYADRLEDTETYDFLYDTVVPSALDEIEEEQASDFPIDVDALKQEAVATAEAILPPEWLDETFRSALGAVLPYILGDKDEFSFTLDTRERVEHATDVIKDETLESDAVASLYDDGMSYLAEQLVENQDNLPFSLELAEADVEGALKEAAPLDWIKPQVSAAIDSALPYFTKDSDHFTVTLWMQDRVDAVADALVDLLAGEETYDYVIEQIITPVVTENIEQAVNLPFSVTLLQDEIATALEDSLPQSWVRAQFESIVDAIAAYMKGETGSISVVIDIADVKDDAVAALAHMADQELESLFYSLPTCSMTQFLLQLQGLQAGEIPNCRPATVSYEEFKSFAGVDVEASVEEMIGDDIPDQWVFTEADLRSAMGADNEDFLDEARDAVADGWEYTEADLLDALDQDERDTLEDIRDWIADGYTFTHEDLRELAEDNDVDLEPFDEAREHVHTARTWWWALWLVPAICLVSIGFLGGRNWKSRLAWAVAVLLISSIILFVGYATAYSSYGEPELQEVLMGPGEYEGLEQDLAEQGNKIILNSVDAFNSGLQYKTLWFLIGSAVVLIGVLAWAIVGPRRGRGAPSGLF